MDSVIKDVGITFIVGAYIVLGFEFALFCVLGRHITGFFNGGLGFEPHAGEGGGPVGIKGTVFIGIAFAIGMLGEDVSFKFMDSDLSRSTRLKTVRSDLRVSTLFRVGLDSTSCSSDRHRCLQVTPDSLGKNAMRVRPEPVTLELFRKDALSFILTNDDASAIKTWVAGNQSCAPVLQLEQHCPTMERLRGIANALYYNAKNVAYRDANYYDELRRVQSRVDFSVSILFFSTLFFGWSVLFNLWALVLDARRKLSASKPSSAKTSDRKQIDDKTKRQSNEIITGFASRVSALVTFALIALVSYAAFHRESSEYNKRVYGYFATELVVPRRDAPVPSDIAKETRENGSATNVPKN